MFNECRERSRRPARRKRRRQREKNGSRRVGQ